MEDRDEYMVTSESLTLWSSLQLYKLIDIIEKVALLSSMSHFGVEILVDYMYFFYKEKIAELDKDNSIENLSYPCNKLYMNTLYTNVLSGITRCSVFYISKV